jgi:hypothetical protein
LPSQTVADAVTAQDSIRIGACPTLTGYYFNVNVEKVEWFRVARALGGRLAFAVMSKSDPTLFNVPYYHGTCEFFLKVFLAGPEGRTESRLPEMEEVEGEEVLTGLRR